MTAKKKRTAMVFHKRKWVRRLGVFLLLVACLTFLLPVAAKYYLTDWLLKNGADHAAIEKLRFNPVAGKLTLGGVTVEAGGKQLLTNSDMVMDIGITSLFGKNIRLQHGHYDNLMIDLEQYEDGSFRVASYTITAINDGAQETEVKSQEDVASAWAFLADELLLKNCTINFKTPDLSISLIVEKAELHKFTTRDGESGGTFTLVGTLNGEKVALDLHTLQVAPSLEIGGKINISGFHFSELEKLLENVLPTFKGIAGLAGDGRFAMSENGGMVADYEGVIDVNGPEIGMDSFYTSAENLNWEGKVRYESPETGPMLVETDGLLSGKNYILELPGSELSNSESLVQLSGKTRVEIDEAVVVKNEGSLLVENSGLELPELSLAEEKLSWKGRVIYDSNREGEGQYVHTDGELELSPLNYLGGGEVPIGAGVNGLHWAGHITYGQQDGGKSSGINFEGVLQGDAVYADLKAQKMLFTQENLVLTSQLDLTFGEKTDISGAGSFQLKNFGMQVEGEDTPMVSLDLLEVEQLQGLGGKNITVEKLNADNLVSRVQGNLPLDIKIPNITLAGFVTEDLVNFRMAELGLQKPEIVSLQNGKELLHFEDINVRNILVGEGGSINSDHVDFNDFVLLGVEDGDDTPGMTLSKARLSGIRWSSDTGFAGESLHFEDLVTTIVRDKEGKINISERLGEMKVNQDGEEAVSENAEPQVEEAAESVAEKTSDTDKEAMPIKLGNVLITGNSNFNFEDFTLAVPFKTDLVFSKFAIDELDSTKPEQKTNILVKGELEKRAPVELTGTLSPFREKMELDLALKLKNYPLTSLSAYTVQSVGTALASGQLQLDTTLAMADDQLDMKNKVLLKKLETKTISKELAEELDNQLPIPLDSALSILRDSKRNINLTIPLSGPVSDLSVGVADILITALSKAIVPAASGYLMYSLGPYGALAYVGMKVGEKMMQVELPPVEFDAGSAVLNVAHNEYLERIGKILQERPETDLQLCPRVASWEFMTEVQIGAVPGQDVAIKEKDRAKLDELGQQRGIAIQEHLVATYAVDKGRLLICETLIETKKETVPALLLQL